MGNDQGSGSLFDGPGEIRSLCRRIDWAATSLGSVDAWPQSLRMAVRLCLEARFPMSVWAGPDLLLIYNDGYPPILGGDRHPWALGRPAREVWSMVWQDQVGPELASVMAGESTWHEDQRFVLPRNGRNEEMFFTYSFTPIQEGDGRVVGALNVFNETTQRVRSLSEREAQYRTLFENAGDAIIIADPEGDGRVLSANPAACDLFGYTEQEFREVARADMLDVGDPAFGELMRARDERGGARAALTYVRKDGSRFKGELRTTLFVDANGRRRAVAIIRDVTEREHAMNQAREERDRLLTLINSMRDEVWLVDASRKLTLANPSVMREFLLPDGSLDAEKLAAAYEVLRPDGSPRSVEEAPPFRALRGETLDGVEEIVRTPATGELRHRMVSAAPIKDAAGNITGSVSVVRDVTELKRVEKALRESEERLHAVLENMSEGLMLFDAKRDLIYQNAASRRILRFESEAAQGGVLKAAWKGWDERGRPLTPDDWPLRRVFREGRIRNQVLHAQQLETGHEFDASYNGSVIRDPEGKLVAAFITIREITEELRAQRALQESEARFRDLADNIAQFAWMADEVGWVFWYSKRWYDYTGTTLDEMKGWGWQKVHHPDHVGRVVDKVRRCFESGEVWEDTFPLRAKDGTYRWFLSQAVPIRDPAGKVLRWFGTNTDVTEQRETEQALRSIERDFRVLVENVYSGVALIDAAGRFSLYNARFLELFGLSPDADIHNVNSHDWGAWQVFDDEGRLLDVDEHPVRKAARTHTPVRNQTIGVRPPSGGDLKWMLVSAAPLVGRDGALDRIICTYHEITERKQTEERVRQLNESLDRRNAELDAERMRWRGVVEGIAEEVWVCDAQGRMSLINLPDSTAMGLEAFEHKTIQDVLDDLEILYPDGRVRPAHEAPLLRSLRTGEVVRGEEMMRHRKTGKLRYRQFSCAPTRDGAGTITGAVAIVRDVTQTKELEHALREADRRKNEFLAVLSHELRNPLAPIMNSLYILDRAPPGDLRGRRALAIIDRQASHMTRLIDDLLDVTRISRGKIRLQHERVEMGDLMRRTAEDHRALFERSGIQLAERYDPAPLFVNGDPTRLAQVIGNLLMNAAKFTPSGGHVVLSAQRSDGGAEIRVVDDGAGIAPELVDRLFEPFVQATQTLDRTHGGLGLGLALVKGLVEMHGGTVNAESKGLGSGAAFTFRIPLETPSRAELSVVPGPKLGERARRVLLIEDNADAAESLKEVLELNNHVVDVAESGPQGIAKARVFKPDLVLCDIGLPGMDGFEVAKAMRADPLLRGTPLVALSGYAGPDDIERGRVAGFDRHLAKPVDVAALERVLTDVTQREIEGRSG